MKTNHVTSADPKQTCPVVDTAGNPLTMGTTYVYHQASSMHQDTTKIMSWEGAPGDGEYISIHYTDRSRWGPNAVTVIGPTLVENLLTGMMEEVYQSQFTPCKDHNNAD